MIGFPLPTGMNVKHLIVAGVVAGLGLTVALFVAGQAFKLDLDAQGAAKMGALFSAAIAIIALVHRPYVGCQRRSQRLNAECAVYRAVIP